MPLPIASKLKIKEGFTLLTMNAPADFIDGLGTLPKQVQLITTGKHYDQVHWFVKNKKELDRQLHKVIKLVKDQVVCWVYYPKGTSGIQTDLTRDKGWEELLHHQEMHWISLISFDSTWSTFAFRLKNAADTKKDPAPKEREILQYIDAKTKTILLPDDLAALLQRNKKEAVFFNSLSFTNKKEYVEWIVTAKRPETRTVRINSTLERLQQQWKNPRNI